MSTAELKLDLINKIAGLKELRIIEEIKAILDFELDKGEYQLSESQKARILEAQNDATLPEEESNDKIEKWLKER